MHVGSLRACWPQNHLTDEPDFLGMAVNFTIFSVELLQNYSTKTISVAHCAKSTLGWSYKGVFKDAEQVHFQMQICVGLLHVGVWQTGNPHKGLINSRVWRMELQILTYYQMRPKTVMRVSFVQRHHALLCSISFVQ